MMLAYDGSRAANGRFVPGHSGNPAGRPKGSRNRATVLAEMLEAGQAAEVVQKFVALALAGDAVALRVCFERLVPKPGAPPVQLDLAPGAERDPAALVTATIRALADGELAPQEAAVIARIAVAGHRILGAAKSAQRGERPPVEHAASSPDETAACGDEPPCAAETGEPEPAATPAIRLFPVAPKVTLEMAPPRCVAASATAAPGAERVSGLYFPAPARSAGFAAARL